MAMELQEKITGNVDNTAVIQETRDLQPEEPSEGERMDLSESYTCDERMKMSQRSDTGKKKKKFSERVHNIEITKDKMWEADPNLGV